MTSAQRLAVTVIVWVVSIGVSVGLAGLVAEPGTTANSVVVSGAWAVALVVTLVIWLIGGRATGDPSP